jgi:hypothetical protein
VDTGNPNSRRSVTKQSAIVVASRTERRSRIGVREVEVGTSTENGTRR